MYRQSEKNLFNSNICSTCPLNMVNFGPLDRLASLGHPANFNVFRILASLYPYCSDVAQRKSTKLCTMFGSLLGWYTLHFGGSCPLTEFWHVQNSLCVQVLPSFTLAALLRGPPAAGVSQTLRRGTRNGITELSQNAPPISAGRPSRWASAHISS